MRAGAVVRTTAVGLNFFDIIQALGAMPRSVAGRSAVQTDSLGSDFAGLVIEPSTGLCCGDQIFGIAQGSLRPYIEASSGCLAALIPRGQRDASMASLPTVALTVAAAVAELGHVLPGDLVAIQAAAGGTGVLALAALRRRGAAVLATAGSARKQCFLRMRGVSRVTSSRSGDAFLRDALAGLPEHCLGADFLLNCLTHDDFIPRGLSVLAPAGRFLELGKLRVWSSPSVQRFRSDVVHATMLLDTRVALAAVSLARELRSIAAAVEAGELQLPPTSLFEFPGQALEAFRLLQSSRQIGKVVLVCDHQLPGAKAED